MAIFLPFTTMTGALKMRKRKVEKAGTDLQDVRKHNSGGTVTSLSRLYFSNGYKTTQSVKIYTDGNWEDDDRISVNSDS